MSSGHGGCLPPKKDEGCFPRRLVDPLEDWLQDAADGIREELIQKAVIERNAMRNIANGRYQEAIALLQKLIDKEREAERVRASVPPETRAAIKAATRDAAERIRRERGQT